MRTPMIGRTGIVALARDIAQVTESLNDALRRAEELLRGLNLNVSAAVTIDDHACVIFKKNGGDWVLGVEAHSLFSHWSNCSRLVRIHIANRLERLFEEMISTGDVQLAELNSALNRALNMATTLQTITEGNPYGDKEGKEGGTEKESNHLEREAAREVGQGSRQDFKVGDRVICRLDPGRVVHVVVEPDEYTKRFEVRARSVRHGRVITFAKEDLDPEPTK